MFTFGIRVAFPVFGGWRVYLRGRKAPVDLYERSGAWAVIA